MSDLIRYRDDLFVPVDFAREHYYYADPDRKQAYTGITSVCGVLAKPALIGWAAKMAVEHVREWVFDKANPHLEGSVAISPLLEVLDEARTAHTKKKEAAGAHGTDAHALVETWVNACLELNGGEPQLIGLHIDGDLNPIRTFIEWALEHVDHFLFSERRMANREHFIAGTADFAYVGKDGKRYMADFKTSSGIYGIDYWCQVAGYRLMAEAEGDEPYDGMTIVRLGKKGPKDFEVQQQFDYETYRDAFLACLTIYRAQGKAKGPTIH